MTKAYRAAQRAAHYDVLIAHARANPLPRPKVLLSDHVNARSGERVHVYIDQLDAHVRVFVTIYDPIIHIPYDPHHATPELAAEGDRIARDLAGRFGEVTRVQLGRTCWVAYVDNAAANAEPTP